MTVFLARRLWEVEDFGLEPSKAQRNMFFACYFVVASLNLDLSRGQILNDAKSIKNSKASTFLRAQIVAKKIRPFFLSVKVLTRRTMRRRTSCENWDFNFAMCTGPRRRYFSEGLIRRPLNGILWDKVIGSYHHFFVYSSTISCW